ARGGRCASRSASPRRLRPNRSLHRSNHTNTQNQNGGAMASVKLPRYANWAALLSGLASILMVITAILSSSLGLGNTFTFILLAQMMLLILLATALHSVLRTQAAALSLSATVIGILAMLLTAVVHVMQLAGAITDEQFNTTGEGIGPAG